jgi:hypothetical protein
MSVFSFVVGEAVVLSGSSLPSWTVEYRPARNSTKLMIVTLQVSGGKIKRVSSPFAHNLSLS